MMQHSSAASAPVDRTSSIRVIAGVVGGVFLAAGVLGFVPGATSNTDSLQFVGHVDEVQLFGLFHVSILQNATNIVLGSVGLLMARHARSAVAFLVFVGLCYLAVWVYGLFVFPPTDANFVPFNGPDDWLTLVIGLVTLGFGLYGRKLLPVQGLTREEEEERE